MNTFPIIFSRYGRIRHGSLGGSPNGSPRASPRNFYSARGISNDVGLSAAITAAQHQLQQGSASTTSKNHVQQSSQSQRANNYHYYTQPVEPLSARGTSSTASGGGSVRLSRKDQINYHSSAFVFQPPPQSNETLGNKSQQIALQLNHANNNNTLLLQNCTTPESIASCSGIIVSSEASSNNSLASNTPSGSSSTTNVMMGGSGAGLGGGSIGGSQNGGSAAWRSKISTTIKNSFLGTPRFHRRKYSAGNNGGASSGSGFSSHHGRHSGDSDMEESLMLDTNEYVTFFIIINFNCKF